ncbi:hypothetical protein [Streptomyces sp. NPDC058667]
MAVPRQGGRHLRPRRTPIGGGWGPYTDTVGIGDADGDGRPDL